MDQIFIRDREIATVEYIASLVADLQEQIDALKAQLNDEADDNISA